MFMKDYIMFNHKKTLTRMKSILAEKESWLRQYQNKILSDAAQKQVPKLKQEIAELKEKIKVFT